MADDNVFISEEALLEFQIALRKAIIQEMLEYAEVQNPIIADILGDILFGVDQCFENTRDL